MIQANGDGRFRMAARTGRAGLLGMEAPGLPLWLCVTQAILAYEWLVSGLDKFLAHGFGGQLSALLSQSVQGDYGGLYSAVIAHLVLPNRTLVALVTPWTETGIGTLMLLGAILWAVRPRAYVTALVASVACLALLTAATLDLNYYLLGGGGLPWIDPANATQPGINVDVMLLLFALALCVANGQAVLRRRHTRHVGTDPSFRG